MKKGLLIFIGASLLILLSACGGNKVDDATAEKYITYSEEVIHLLNEFNYEEIYERFDDIMKDGLPITAMQELSPIIDAAGNFEKIDKASIEEKDGYYITVSIAKYSNQKLIYTINYNENEEIVGFFIK